MTIQEFRKKIPVTYIRVGEGYYFANLPNMRVATIYQIKTTENYQITFKTLQVQETLFVSTIKEVDAAIREVVANFFVECLCNVKED